MQYANITNEQENRTFSITFLSNLYIGQWSFIAKNSDCWRFSDLISYFCNWFRASADGAGHIYERFVTFPFTLKLRKFEQQKEM